MYEASELRRRNIPNVLDALGHQLDILTSNADPEKVGRFLTEPTNDYEKAEGRRVLAAELRLGAKWLARVIEGLDEAEGAEAP